MANEAVIIELINGGVPISYTCLDANGIAKGTILEMSGDRTVIANTNANTALVGIAAAEKVALDGTTTIQAYTNGIFGILTTAGAKVAGVLLAGSATENTLEAAAGEDLLNCSYLGNLMENSAGGVVSVVRVLK